MSNRILNFFAVTGVLAITFLVIAVLITAQVGLELMGSNFWIGVCHVVLVFLSVAALFGGLFGSILILPKKTPE